jgi:hypothetical protein
VTVANPDLPPAFANACFSALKGKNEKNPSQLGRCKRKKEMKRENGIERRRKDKRRKKQERRLV